MTGSLITDDSQIGWRQDDDWVWRVQFDASTVALPAVTHLRIPGGAPLLASPGLQFRWARINGVAYFPENATPGARVEWRPPKFEALPDGGAVVRQRIDYRHPEGRREIAEYRDLVFSAVGRNGKYSLDWTSHFTAGEAGALLEDAAPGRAGLRLPLAGAAEDEPVDFIALPALESVPAPSDRPADLQVGAGMSTLLYPAARHPGSIAFVADPRSTIGPHAWQILPAERLVVAALLGGRPRQLEPGEVWEISYRLVVRPKQWDEMDARLELFRWLGR